MDQALVAGVKLAKTRPCNYAIVWKDSNEGKIILSKKRIPPGDVKAAKKAVGGVKTLLGTAFFESGKCVFEKLPTDPTPPKAVILLKLLFKEGTGKKVNVELREVETLTPVDEDAASSADDDAADDDAPAPKGPPKPAAVSKLLDQGSDDPNAEIARLRKEFARIAKSLPAIEKANPWGGGRARELLTEGLKHCALVEKDPSDAKALKKARRSLTNLKGVLKAVQHKPGKPHEVKVPLKTYEPVDGLTEAQVGVSNRIAKEIHAKSGGVGAEQSSRDFGELMTIAKKSQAVLGQMTEKLAEKHGGRAMVPTEIKGEGRAMEKVTGKYKDCAEKLTDISRSSLAFRTMKALYAALDDMGKTLNIVTIKDRFAAPTPAGYRDILLNVQLENGHIVEMQLHHEKMLQAKSGPLEGTRTGHDVYDDQRAVDDAIAAGSLPLTQEIQEYLDALDKESKGIYYGMWDQIREDEGL